MTTISLHTRTLTKDLNTGPDMGDITPDLKRCLEGSGVTKGVIHVFVPGATGSVTTIEYEPGVVVINHDNHPRARKIEVTIIGA